MLELVKMTHICQYWRTTLISFPHLWSSVFVKKGHKEFVAACLERSRQVPLDVHLDMTYGDDCGYCGIRSCRCLELGPSTQVNERNMCHHHTAIFPLLNSRHTERIRNLDTHLTVADDSEGSADYIFRSALGNLKFCASSLPSLETLSFSMHFDFDYFDNISMDFPGDMFCWDTSPPTNLRHLILHGCFGGPILSLQNVTSFELTGESEYCSMDINPHTFLQFISGNPSLASLTLAHCIFPDRSKLPSVIPVDLSQLKTVQLTDIYPLPSFPCLIEIPALKSLTSLHTSSQRRDGFVGDFRIYARGDNGFQISIDVPDFGFGEPVEEKLISDWVDIMHDADPRPSFVRLEREYVDPYTGYGSDVSHLPLLANAKILEISASFADRWRLNLWDDLKKIGPQLATLCLEVAGWMDTEDTAMFADSVKEFVKARLEKGMPLKGLERMKLEGMSEEDERKSERLWKEFRASLDIDQYIATNG